MARHLVWLWLLALLLFAPAAEAHKPLWGEGEQIEIPDLTTSFAAYQNLSEPEQVDTFVVEARAGDRLDAGITIPRMTGLENFGVRAALVGPGLPAAGRAQLPGTFPEELGARIFPSRVGEPFFEPFTQTRYWGRQEFALTLPETGTYNLLIWQPEGMTGKYVLVTGSEERFAPADLLRFPIWWVRVHAFFNHTPYLLLAATLLLVAIAGAWRLHRRRAR